MRHGKLREGSGQHGRDPSMRRPVTLPRPASRPGFVGETAGLGWPENYVLAVESLKGDCSVWEVFDEGVVGREIVGVVQIRIFAIASKKYLSAGLTVEQLQHS